MIKTYLAILIVAIVAYPNLIHALKYSICEKNISLADIMNVTVSDCETSLEACPFVRGFNKSIEMDFVPKEKVEQVKIKVAGKLSTLPLPFPVNPDNACGNYGIECPLEAGKLYKFKLTLPILRTYPKIYVDVFLRLIDEKGSIIGCIELPARIQEPQKE